MQKVNFFWKKSGCVFAGNCIDPMQCNNHLKFVHKGSKQSKDFQDLCAEFESRLDDIFYMAPANQDNLTDEQQKLHQAIKVSK